MKFLISDNEKLPVKIEELAEFYSIRLKIFKERLVHRPKSEASLKGQINRNTSNA